MIGGASFVCNDPKILLYASSFLIMYGVIRLFLYFNDTRYILDKTNEKGWKNVEVIWSPFAPGWIGERGERLYLVRYTDHSGISKQQFCKRGILTGLFWRDGMDI